MRKLMVVSLLCSTLLVGCSTTTPTKTNDWAERHNVLRERMQEDHNKQFQILQVSQDGSFLAKRCTSMIGKDYCSGPIVLMPSGTDPLPYDQKMIHLNNPQVVDTYTYTDRLGVMHTVAVIIDKKE